MNTRKIIFNHWIWSSPVDVKKFRDWFIRLELLRNMLTIRKGALAMDLPLPYPFTYLTPTGFQHQLTWIQIAHLNTKHLRWPCCRSKCGRLMTIGYSCKHHTDPMWMNMAVCVSKYLFNQYTQPVLLFWYYHVQCSCNMP